jgi:CheY-like chemotaxis protein
VQVNKRPFALSPLFDQLAQDLGSNAQERKLQLRLRPTDGWVMSDATLVYRMLLNLVGNALRYTERGGVLVVARRTSREQVLLQVWDTGLGIAPEHQQAVFTEFFQVANPARDRTKGLGLGLNIVQRTAALLEHPLQMVSELGRGTRFSLTLPLAQSQAGVLPTVSIDRPVADDLRGLSVLVIEDDVLARTALVDLLASWGMQVLQAHDMHSALQHLADGARPAVIVSDYRLSEGHDGMALVQLLRARLGQDTPAFLISGDTDPALIKRAQAAQLTLLHKPVRPAKLRTLLRRLVADQCAADSGLS